MPLYRIAGLTVDMQPHFALTGRRAEVYRTDATSADLLLTGQQDDAASEYASLARSFYEQLLGFDGFLLHASVVELEGKAYAFSAPSGTGKSTHASFWEREHGASVINDDKPAIRLIDGTFCACGTPFSGKHDKSRPVCVPLAGVVFLHRAAQTTVQKMPLSKALWSLLDQTLRPKTARDYERLLTLLEEMLRQVPVYAAGVTNDPAAARIVRAALENA